MSFHTKNILIHITCYLHIDALYSYSNLDDGISYGYLLLMLNFGATEISKMCKACFWSLEFDRKIAMDTRAQKKAVKKNLLKN